MGLIHCANAEFVLEEDTRKQACGCFLKASFLLASQGQHHIFSEKSPREAQQGHPLSG
jgi:hypothetical protein